MELTIREVKSKGDLRTFIHLPERIHEHHQNWLPPLYLDEWKLFSATKNPAFMHCETILLLALEGEKPVGRIMGIIHHPYNQKHQLKTARFAFIECYHDKHVFNTLISHIENWAIANNCTEVIGPMGFSDKEPQGFLIKGFERETMMVTNCSFPYMVSFIEQAGYQPHIDLCQHSVRLTEDIIERYRPFAVRAQRNHALMVQEFTSTRAIVTFIKPVFDLINKTYVDIYGFSTITIAEMDEFITRFLPLLDPRLIKVITNEQGKVLAFVVAMADLSNGLRKAKGRIFPVGWVHILLAGRKSKRLVLLLGAIADEMRGKGLDAILGYFLLKSAVSKGFTTIDSHLIMKDNYKMRREIERLENFDLYKEYRIFSKVLPPRQS